MSLLEFATNIYAKKGNSFTYDHRILRTELPVRSAVLKQDTGGLVVRWVTTGEYPLLYVFGIFCLYLSERVEIRGHDYYFRRLLRKGDVNNE